MKIILASTSPRRNELMKLITDDFKTVSADIEEVLPEAIKFDASMYFANMKAWAVSERFPNDIVIGCDTIVTIDNMILGKPKDKEQCREYLKMLSGRTHSVITSCVLKYKNELGRFSEVTDVTFRELSPEDIEWYISTGEPFDKAGGYGIQGKGALLVDKINGDFFNVVGLPVSKLNLALKMFIEDINSGE